MVVELNAAFVPEHLQTRLEYHLRNAWARTRLSPSAFKVRWTHRDPGELIVAVELGKARVLWSKPEEASADAAGLLIEELQRKLQDFLRANHN